MEEGWVYVYPQQSHGLMTICAQAALHQRVATAC